jgi:hypothetical protein
MKHRRRFTSTVTRTVLELDDYLSTVDGRVRFDGSCTIRQCAARGYLASTEPYVELLGDMRKASSNIVCQGREGRQRLLLYYGRLPTHRQLIIPEARAAQIYSCPNPASLIYPKAFRTPFPTTQHTYQWKKIKPSVLNLHLTRNAWYTR